MIRACTLALIAALAAPAAAGAQAIRSITVSTATPGGSVPLVACFPDHDSAPQTTTLQFPNGTCMDPTTANGYDGQEFAGAEGVESFDTRPASFPITITNTGGATKIFSNVAAQSIDSFAHNDWVSCDPFARFDASGHTPTCTGTGGKPGIDEYTALRTGYFTNTTAAIPTTVSPTCDVLWQAGGDCNATAGQVNTEGFALVGPSAVGMDPNQTSNVFVVTWTAEP